VLRNRLFKTAGVEIEAVRKELTAGNSKQLLANCELVVDAFDNSGSRRAVQDAVRLSGVACLHVGLNADYAEVIWDEAYRVPNDVAGDLCDYPLARNLVLIAVAVASEVVVRFAASAARESWSLTLGDFGVRPVEPA
jgi:molybdopterin/thiamine biosynthesis adenylyltransferase